MAKNPQFLSCLIAWCAIFTGCTKSPGSAVSNLPKFQISSEDSSRLSDVGCAVSEADLKCDEPVVSESRQDTSLNALKSLKKKQEDQKTVLDEIALTVKAANKSGKYEPIAATILIAKLETASALSAAHVAESVVAITNEENYQKVIGYHCEGSYQHEAEFKTTADFLLDAPTPTKIVRDDDAHYVSTLDLSVNDRKISYKLTDSMDSSKQSLRQLVQTDGEFTSVTNSEGSAKMNCARTRAYGSAQPFSDRIRESAYYKCSLTSTFNGKASSGNMSFPVSRGSDRNIDLVVVEAMDESMNDRPEARVLFQKYVAHALFVQGLLQFKIEDLTSKKEVLAFSTPNSTANFRLNVDDSKGNAYDVNCTRGKD
jgi:hypothetical protein